MKFKMGDYVVIVSDYPHDRMLQGQTGNIIGLPSKEHPDEYFVELDGGITQHPFFKGQQVWVSVNWLEIADRAR